MSDPGYEFSAILKLATDLFSYILDDNLEAFPEEIVKMGKDIKRATERLVDMAWYKADSEDWDKKHPGHVGTKL